MPETAGADGVVAVTGAEEVVHPAESAIPMRRRQKTIRFMVNYHIFRVQLKVPIRHPDF
jgi:hypothetical protein